MPDHENIEQDGVITQAIVVVTPQSRIRIAGLSVLQRTVFALERSGVPSITLVAHNTLQTPLERPLTRREKTRVRCCKAAQITARPTGFTLLLLCPAVLNAEVISALSDICDSATPVAAIDRADRQGRSTATSAYLVSAPAAAEIPQRVADAVGAEENYGDNTDVRVQVPDGIFYPLPSTADRTEIRRAEKQLLGSLRKKTDGYFAYWFDRRISTQISLQLVRTGVTPNQISIFTLFLVLASAVAIATPNPLISGSGAILFLISTILDGCDGEVARLKYLESALGARLDLVCDNIGLVALFIGIIVNVYSHVPGTELLYAGAAIIGGMLTAMIAEYLLITGPRIRHGQGPSTAEESNRHELYERLASRDFAYLLPILAFTQTLSWFVWATAIGVNLFWIVLIFVVVRKPARNDATGVRSKLP